MPYHGLGYVPGQQFRMRMTVATGAGAVNTAVINKNYLEIVGGAYLSVTTGASTTQFTDTKLGTTNTYLGRTVEFTEVTTAANLRQRRIITAYTVASSQATVGVALGTITAADKYKILSPVPANVRSIALAGITYNPMTTIDINDISVIFAMTNADGDRWATQIVEGTAVNFWPGMMFPTPVEFPFHQDVTLTATLATAVNWPTAAQIYWHFVY